MPEPEPAVVPTAAGGLRAQIQRPGPGIGSATSADADRLLPGVVLVDGSGDGTVEHWDRWPGAIADCGAVVLCHDKPGCGGSPGDWHEQDFADRAAESLAALEVLRAQPGVDPDRVGLLGISQGGWVCQQAAATRPDAVAFFVTISGPGVTPMQQERLRIANLVDGDAEAMAWFDERARRMLAGDDPERILADQAVFADRPWFEAVREACSTPDLIRFGMRIGGCDPAEILPEVRCPVFAAFGGADPSIPVARSVAVYAERLPHDQRHVFVVYPRADHNLFVGERDRAVPLASQLATGFFPMLTDWLASGIAPARPADHS